MNKKKDSLSFLQVGSIIITHKGEYTNWTLIEELPIKVYVSKGKKSHIRFVKVKCKCGEIKDVRLSTILRGGSSSCFRGECYTPKKVYKDRTEDTSYNHLYKNYKSAAFRRDYEFNLTFDEFIAICKKDCHYCDSKPLQYFKIQNPKTKEIRSGIPIYYNGIDRVDNKEGYNIDNTVPCCKICNIMKSILTVVEFREHINKIHKKFNDE